MDMGPLKGVENHPDCGSVRIVETRFGLAADDLTVQAPRAGNRVHRESFGLQTSLPSRDA